MDVIWQLMVCISLVKVSAGTLGKRDQKKLVLADLTSNRFTREHDGTLGMWSFHGTADESSARFREFAFNGDLIDEDLFHQGIRNATNLATMTPPILGVTSDLDDWHLTFLIMQAKVANIDGFMIEWGYKGHQSDVVLRKLLKILQNGLPYSKHFLIGVNWCDHWLKMHLQNASSSELVDAFVENALYLIQEVFNGNRFAFRYHHKLVVFLFGGGLTAEQFEEASGRIRNVSGTDDILWVGNYLNMARTENQRWNWTHLLNGIFGWSPHAYRPTQGNMSLYWDYYTLPEDTIDYQENVSVWAQEQVRHKQWSFWASSATPGEDNRGCAAWGRKLENLPRIFNNSNSYELQWDLNLLTSANAVFIVTFNDFSEGTVILPTENYRFQTLVSTAVYANRFKGGWLMLLGVVQPKLWYQFQKEVDFLSQIQGLNVTDPQLNLVATKNLLMKGHYANGRHFLQYIGQQVQRMWKQVAVNHLDASTVSEELIVIGGQPVDNDTFLVNQHQRLLLQLNEDTAQKLRGSVYTGILTFDYLSQSSNFSRLVVQSSSNRSSSDTKCYKVFPRHYDPAKHPVVFTSDFSVVCQLGWLEDSDWKHAAVEVFQKNAAWDHSLEEEADLKFMTNTPGSSFLVQNVTLVFYTYSYGSNGTQEYGDDDDDP